MKRPLAYITAPWGDNCRENEENAARYCRQVYDAGYSPICPASSQAPYRSPRRKRQVSFAPLLLLFPRNPLRWACVGSPKMLSTFLKDSIPQEHKDGIDMARDYGEEKSLRVFEAFAGIGAQASALERIGIDYEIVGIRKQ